MHEFVLSAPERVRLTIYDLLGRRVATLLDATLAAGSHDAVFDATNLPGGVYVYRLTTEARNTTTGTIVLMK